MHEVRIRLTVHPSHHKNHHLGANQSDNNRTQRLTHVPKSSPFPEHGVGRPRIHRRRS